MDVGKERQDDAIDQMASVLQQARESDDTIYIHLTVVFKTERGFTMGHKTMYAPAAPPEFLTQVHGEVQQHLTKIAVEHGAEPDYSSPPRFLRWAGWHDLIFLGGVVGFVIGQLVRV